MTKEELEKEAEEYAKENYRDEVRATARNAYLDCARLKEKQIQIDAEQIRALQKQNGELTDENERLKGDLELWESGSCRATNLDKCGVVKELTDELTKKADTNHQLVEQMAKLSERCSELEAQIEKMKKELHHRLVSPSHSDSDCLDKIIGLDRLWQFGQEF